MTLVLRLVCDTAALQQKAFAAFRATP